MRDIVATIQPDQDDIVRADADATVCVQGAPGTGKTAVGLHRVAYLLYAHANRMKRGGVLVIGPNRAFLAYIGNVLPALGEVGVEPGDDRRPGRHRRGPGHRLRARGAHQGGRPDGGGAAPGAVGRGVRSRPAASCSPADPGGGGCPATRSPG